MAEVLELRLIAELRESQGATYSPNVSYNHSLVWPNWGYVSATVEIPPAKLPAFFSDVRKIASDLRSHPPTADEMERAKKPRIDNIEKARETNGYWLGELSGAQADPPPPRVPARPDPRHRARHRHRRPEGRPEGAPRRHRLDARSETRGAR